MIFLLKAHLFQLADKGMGFRASGLEHSCGAEGFIPNQPLHPAEGPGLEFGGVLEHLRRSVAGCTGLGMMV